MLQISIKIITRTVCPHLQISGFQSLFVRHSARLTSNSSPTVRTVFRICSTQRSSWFGFCMGTMLVVSLLLGPLVLALEVWLVPLVRLPPSFLVLSSWRPTLWRRLQPRPSFLPVVGLVLCP